MEGRRLVIIEANEVPRRVVEDVATSGRLPFLTWLLSSDRLIDTRSYEQLDRELYPSQSWASMNTGVGYSDHGIYWYGDPKPERYPMYWQLAEAEGRSVGLVNTLHSSPLAERCPGPGYRFVVPDCFGADPSTKPEGFRAFQQLNLDLTRANGRKTSLMAGPRRLVGLAGTFPGLGLRPSTGVELAALVGGAAVGRIPRERLRTGQFMILRDLFLKLVTRKDPDLAVFFTNHVAASMHRYWYAMYPGDFERTHYDDDWVERHRDEIPHALSVLDDFLGELSRWCAATDRTLVVSSSMGQGPSQVLGELDRHEVVVTDPGRFLAELGVDERVVVVGSMVPQLTLDCGTSELADETQRRLRAGSDRWLIDRTGNVVTLTYAVGVVDSRAGTVMVGGRPRAAASVGVTVHEVDDHSSGRHIPLGILGVANSPSFKPPSDEYVDVMEYAPAVLEHLGVEPAPHHQTPRFQI